MNQTASQKTFFGHPRGLATLFFTEMWERFSYYGMRALLVLFMTAAVSNGGFGFNDSKAGAIYGLYTMGVYLLALPGGWLADRFIGQRRAVWYGGIIIALGHFSMAYPTQGTFYLGLVLVVIGTGLLKPNVSTMVGDLYPEGGARRDAGFSIFYTGINLGAFLGPLLCSLFGEKVNWHIGFGLAGIGMILGLIQYKLTEHYLGSTGVSPKASEGQQESQSWGRLGGAGIGLILLVLVLHFSGVIDLSTIQGVAQASTVIIVSIFLFYFSYQLLFGGFNPVQKRRIMMIFCLVIAAAVFWSGFEQAGTSLNLFAKYSTDRIFFGWEVPTGWYQNINAIFIIVLSPFFGALWINLARRNLQPSIPLKFALGLVFLGLGFLVMYFAAKLAIESNVGSKWLTLTYLFHTTGELCLSPVGLSAMTKLAPKRITGQMMGIWFLATALGNLVAGQVAGNFDFSALEQADAAKGKISQAATLSDDLLADLDPALIAKIDPTILANKDLPAFKVAIEEITDNTAASAKKNMPNLFWMITMMILGAGIIMLILVIPIKKLAPDIK